MNYRDSKYGHDITIKDFIYFNPAQIFCFLPLIVMDRISSLFLFCKWGLKVWRILTVSLPCEVLTHRVSKYGKGRFCSFHNKAQEAGCAEM